MYLVAPQRTYGHRHSNYLQASLNSVNEGRIPVERSYRSYQYGTTCETVVAAGVGCVDSR